jgi:hypothetical protein
VVAVVVLASLVMHFFSKFVLDGTCEAFPLESISVFLSTIELSMKSNSKPCIRVLLTLFYLKEVPRCKGLYSSLVGRYPRFPPLLVKVEKF